MPQCNNNVSNILRLIVSLARCLERSRKVRRYLCGQTTAFLNFCRIEKGLSANSIAAYTADLSRFVTFAGEAQESARDSGDPLTISIIYTKPGSATGPWAGT